jgi:hypothetical protein
MIDIRTDRAENYVDPIEFFKFSWFKLLVYIIDKLKVFLNHDTLKF